MADEEYYFEDDGGYDYDNGGDYGDQGGEVDDSLIALQNSYSDGKQAQAADKARALECFEHVVAADTAHGVWTFKALKSCYRVCLRHGDEEGMVGYYQKALDFDYTGRTRHDVEKMMRKIADRCTRMSVATQRDVCVRALKMTTEGDKIWPELKQRLAQFALQLGQLDEAEAHIADLLRWCGEDKEAAERRGTMLYNIYALEIQLRSERKDTRRLHELYQRAVSITNAVPAPRTVAVVHECGAKLFLQKQLWNQAHKALVKAFQSYDEAGDARRISCLKYLVVSAVLSDSKVNPFDLKEAAALQDNPEVAVLTDLIDCSTRRDVQRFMQILGDPIRGRTLSADAFLRALIEPLISQMQGAALVALARPYSALRLGYIAKALAMTAADAERLCVRLILERQLPGAQIDQLEQVLYLDPAATRAAAAAADAAAKGNQNAATAPATETAQAQVLAKLLQQNADALRAATVNISVPWTRQLVLA